jgi:hypothetical protein
VADQPYCSAQVSHGGEIYDSTTGTAATDAEAIEKARAWGMTVPCQRERVSLNDQHRRQTTTDHLMVVKSPLPRWDIYIVLDKGAGMLLGTVEAASEAEAIKIGAERFGQPKERLMAVRR